MEMMLFVLFSGAKFFVGADGINWSTASKMLFAGPYSMNSSESRSSTTDSNTLERTANTQTNKQMNTCTCLKYELWGGGGGLGVGDACMCVRGGGMGNGGNMRFELPAYITPSFHPLFGGSLPSSLLLW